MGLQRPAPAKTTPGPRLVFAVSEQLECSLKARHPFATNLGLEAVNPWDLLPDGSAHGDRSVHRSPALSIG
jgi:hypothetical protein